MIRASDLRIGNWFLEFCIPTQADSRFIDRLFNIQHRNKVAIDVSPIPLTPEIMDKIGDRRSVLGQTNIFWSVGEFEFLYSLEDVALQKGLHWFQNFHYFRTGEELNYQP